MAVIYWKRYLRKWCRYKDLSTEVSHSLIYIWNFPQPTPSPTTKFNFGFYGVENNFANSLWTKYRVGLLGFGWFWPSFKIRTVTLYISQGWSALPCILSNWKKKTLSNLSWISYLITPKQTWVVAKAIAYNGYEIKEWL